MPYIDEIFDMEDAELAVIYATSSVSKSIQIKFFNAYELAKMNKVDITACKPEAHARTEDVAGYEYGSKIVIRGLDYFIKEIHPDGTGLTVLLLTQD